MSRPLRIVQIAPYPLFPTSAGGKIRIVQLARTLSALGVDVTVVAPFHFTQRRALIEREPFTFHQVSYPFLIPLLFVDRPIPFGSLVSFHPGYRAMLPVSLEDYDICQIEHPAFVDLLRHLPNSVPVVYGSQNTEFDYVEYECRSEWVRRSAGGRVRRLEAQLIKRADHVFACTEADRDRFKDLYAAESSRVTILPNGVDLNAAREDRARAASSPSVDLGNFASRAVFAGSAVHHNHEAVRKILSRVAPAFEREIEFVIIGGCARIFQGDRRPNVRFDPDGELVTYAGPDTIGLNPVVDGSGSSLKLLQYLAYNLPVLTTRFGLRGFENLEPWVTQAEIDDFPDALRAGVHEPDGVQEQLERYEWSNIAKEALRVYETLAGRRDAGR